MNVRPKHITTVILDLLEFFQSHCADTSTMRQLSDMAANEERWHLGHDLFQEIRQKSILAEKAGKEIELSQYLFEEVCAKTLYNLSKSPAPFDPDSPFWILPNALSFGRYLGVSDPTDITSLL